MPTPNRLTRSTSKVGAILACLFLVAMLLPGAVLAANTVTPASGTALSADRNSVDGSGAWTTITGPQVNGTGGTLGAGTVVFTIADAGEFAFNPGVGSASLSGGAGCGTLAISPAVPTVVAASVTVTLTGASSAACNLVLSGLQVRPTAAGAAPLETSAIDTSGTAGVTGSAGTLSVVPGAAILSFQVAPSPTSVTAGVDFTTSPTIRSRDQYNNLRAGDSDHPRHGARDDRAAVHVELGVDRGRGRRLRQLPDQHRGIVRAPRDGRSRGAGGLRHGDHG